MRRIAFFVEGQTERLFLHKLIGEIFNIKKIAIQTGKIQGGSSTKISFTQIVAAVVTEETQYYILIYDCGGETNVASYIKEHREKLIASGYSKIIGIRDVYPSFRRDQILKLKQGLLFRMPQVPIPIMFVLPVMETECWFLSEFSHFSKIDQSLSPELIKSTLGFDPSVDNMEERDCPADDLNQCYQLANLVYSKDENTVKRTIDSLDYSKIYFELNDKILSLGELIKEINDFID